MFASDNRKISLKCKLIELIPPLLVNHRRIGFGDKAFADAAAGRAPYPMPQSEMVTTIAALEALVRSAATGAIAPVSAAL
ncbi:MAG: hypothetical protein KGJ66_12585 [Alphaproteobacteria bacterium]|nr:hypothetical protein [Alphaproteobacteria bacterium]